MASKQVARANKQALVEAVWRQAAISNSGTPISRKFAKELTETIFDTIKTSLKEKGRFTYPYFGTWMVKHRSARSYFGMKRGLTGKMELDKTARVEKPGQNVVRFRTAKVLKNQANEFKPAERRKRGEKKEPEKKTNKETKEKEIV